MVIKYLLILALLPFALKSEPLSPIKSEMVYFRVGVNAGGRYEGMGSRYVQIGTGAELSLGYRKTFGHHVWDINGGAILIESYSHLQYPSPYVQSSYLFFPEVNHGFYLGVGLALIPLTLIDQMILGSGSTHWGLYIPIIPVIPITTGYQFKNSNQFIQFQLQPAIRTGAFSYGVGF